MKQYPPNHWLRNTAGAAQARQEREEVWKTVQFLVVCALILATFTVFLERQSVQEPPVAGPASTSEKLNEKSVIVPANNTIPPERVVGR